MKLIGLILNKIFAGSDRRARERMINNGGPQSGGGRPDPRDNFDVQTAMQRARGNSSGFGGF